MGLESATYITDLVSSNPLGSDLESQGDDHLRLIKAALQATFPNASREFRLPSAVAVSTTTPLTISAAATGEKLFPINATAGVKTVNLPTAPYDFYTVQVFKTDGSANAVVVDGNSTDTIKGPNAASDNLTYSLRRQNQCVTFVWSLADLTWYAFDSVIAYSPPDVVTVGNATLTQADDMKVRRFDATAAARTYTLVNTVLAGTTVRVVKTDSSTNSVVLDATTGGSVNGAATYVLYTQWAFADVTFDGTTWILSSTVDQAVVTPQGYLTLSSNATDVVLTADATSQANVYYSPFVGNLVPVSDGVGFTQREFSQLTLALHANHLASTIYDVFLFNDAGVLRLGTGPAWTASGAGVGTRSTGAGTSQLARLKGLWTNAVAITARNGATTYAVAAGAGTYLGSVAIDAVAGQCTCHITYGQSRTWGVWNAYNRRELVLKGGDPAVSWTYTSATIRASNGAAANNLTILTGLPELCLASFKQNIDVASNAAAASRVRIGINSTTVGSGFSGRQGSQTNSGSLVLDVLATFAEHSFNPAIGINTITALEQSDGSVQRTMYGTEADMLLASKWRG